MNCRKCQEHPAIYGREHGPAGADGLCEPCGLPKIIRYEDERAAARKLNPRPSARKRRRPLGLASPTHRG